MHVYSQSAFACFVLKAYTIWSVMHASWFYISFNILSKQQEQMTDNWNVKYFEQQMETEMLQF